MDKILYEPTEGTTGFWGLRDVPTQPNEDDYKRHRAPGLNDFIRAESDYIKTLESCKSNSLEIVNPEDAGFHVSEITGLVTHRPKKSSRILNPVKPGDLFDLPIGYEFKEEEKDGNKVLRLQKIQ